MRDSEDAGSTRLPKGITPEEAARYSHELIDSLRKLALGQKHLRLAQLLEAAEGEAKTLLIQAAPRNTSA